MIRDNPDGFYTGELAKNIVRDMAAKNGLITAGDLRNYSAVIREALNNKLGGLNMYTAPAPASGPVIALILNILKGNYMSKKVFLSYFHQQKGNVAELFKTHS